MLGDAAPPPSLSDLPPVQQTATGDTPEPVVPSGPIDYTGAIVGGLAGAILALGLAVVSTWLPDWLGGVLLGALAGVLLAPLVATSMLLAAIRSDAVAPFSLGDLAAQGFWSGLATASNERRYGRVLGAVLGFVFVGMVLGGLLGSTTRLGPVALTIGAVLGAGCLGAGVGFWLRPTGPGIARPD